MQFVAIADVKESVRESVKSYVDGIYGNKECEMIHDVAELLPRKDIDALLIATSDRWHGPMACGRRRAERTCTARAWRHVHHGELRRSPKTCAAMA